MSSRPLFIALVALAATLPFSHCRKQQKTPTAEVGRLLYTPSPASLADEFSGENAFDHVEEILTFGPRPPASEGHEATIKYLEETLKALGWKTTRQSFRAATPDGPTPFTNLLARHASAPPHPASVPVVIGGHFDSKKLPFPFVGANDGGSSTGIMLELARVLASDPASAAKVELVFFDGEEAFRPGITARDGLYGSKYFAHDLSTRESWPAVGIVLDIVGDSNFELFYNPDSPLSFGTLIDKLAQQLPFTKPILKAPGPILDDHVPLMGTGLPCLHVIGNFNDLLNKGNSMTYWHQEGDTLDKIDPAMLGNVGKLTLLFLSEVAPPKAP